MNLLNKKEIEKLIDRNQLVEGYINLSRQLTPNGIDLTVGKIFEFDSQGALDFSNSERVVPEGKEVFPKKKNPKEKYGWWKLKKGSYKVRTNEQINLPNDLVALAFTRTSLLRMGGLTQNGVWDAGFNGKGEFILVIENNAGIDIKENARLIQLVFIPTDETKSYEGVYKHLK